MQKPVSELEGRFCIPHDDPPKWLAMLYAYLDETGQETRDWVFIAGYLGNKEQWHEFEERWPPVLAEFQRKRLHMKDLRWKRDSTRCLLEKLGPIPYECGLKKIVSGVNVGHYQDMIAGSLSEQMLARGYEACLIPTLTSILQVTPPDERVEFVFEAQDQHEDATNRFFTEIAEESLHHPEMGQFRTSDGRSKIANWTFVPKGSTMLLDPADYLAYAILQYHRDPNSQKSEWTRSILDEGPIDRLQVKAIGNVLSRDEIRSFVLQCHGQQLDVRRLHFMTDTNSQQAEIGSHPVSSDQIKRKRADNFLKVYANSVEVRSHVWDFRLVFGESDKSGTQVEESAEIIFSPQQAKALSRILAANVSMYEKRFGEINLPAAPEPKQGEPK